MVALTVWGSCGGCGASAGQGRVCSRLIVGRGDSANLLDLFLFWSAAYGGGGGGD